MCRLEIIVGVGFERNGKPVENVGEKLVALRQEAGKLLGGFSYYPSFGGYINDAGAYVEEPGVTIVTFHEPSTENTFAANSLVQFAKNLFNQESIAVGVSNAQFNLVK